MSDKIIEIKPGSAEFNIQDYINGLEIRNFFFSRAWRGKSYLNSPFIDFMTAGGFAFLLLPFLFFEIIPKSVNGGFAIMEYSYIFGFLIAYSGVYINYPHFAYTYLLMYRDFGKKITDPSLSTNMKNRYYINGIFIPVFFVVYIFASILMKSELAFGLIINAMYFTVAWHYAKQSFGIMMMYCTLKKFYFLKWERSLLLLNIHWAWVTSWLSHSRFSASNESTYYGITYFSLPLKKYFPFLFTGDFDLYTFMYNITFLLLFATIVMIINKMVREKKVISLSGLVGYMSFYVWIIFVWVIHPFWAFFAPAFHCIQYNAFIFAFERNRYEIRKAEAVKNNQPFKEVFKTSVTSITGAKNFYKRPLVSFIVFLLGGVLIGMVQFEWGGKIFSYIFDPNELFASPVFYLGVITAYVNIHHYFMDNTIWRKGNPEISKYLLVRSTDKKT